MAEAVVEIEDAAPFFNDTDNFIQSHLDSHFPTTEELLQEEKKEEEQWQLFQI